MMQKCLTARVCVTWFKYDRGYKNNMKIHAYLTNRSVKLYMDCEFLYKF